MRSEWLFIRGLGRESVHWAAFPDAFAAKVPNSRILFADLPGNGRHSEIPTPASIPGMLDFIRQNIHLAEPSTRDASCAAPRYLLAVSLGAMVAIEWMSRYPGEIAGAVLINTSLRGVNRLHQRLRWPAWPALIRILSTAEPALREQRVLKLTSRQHARDLALAEAYADAFRLRPIRRINLLRQLWAAATHHARISPPPSPLLLLASRGDQMVDPSCSAAIAKRWQAPLMTHPWAGHDLPLDDPEWVADHVKAWLEQCSSCNQAVTEL